MYEIYKKLRDDAGFTDYYVAMETGIPGSTFQDWKSGRSEPKFKKLVALADFFKVSVEIFAPAVREVKE